MTHYIDFQQYRPKYKSMTEVDQNMHSYLPSRQRHQKIKFYYLDSDNVFED